MPNRTVNSRLFKAVISCDLTSCCFNKQRWDVRGHSAFLNDMAQGQPCRSDRAHPKSVSRQELQNITSTCPLQFGRATLVSAVCKGLASCAYTACIDCGTAAELAGQPTQPCQVRYDRAATTNSVCRVHPLCPCSHSVMETSRRRPATRPQGRFRASSVNVPICPTW